MRRLFILLFVAIAVISITGPAECGQNREKLMNDIEYRQKEFTKKWEYLSGKEMNTALELNREISAYNEKSTAVGLQKIEDLKVKIMDTLQDQIINDRDYIAYLERKLTEISKTDLDPVEFKEEMAEAGGADYKADPEVAGTDEETVGSEDELDFEIDFAKYKNTADKLMEIIAPVRYED
ncbi:MAG: hypothetical protein ABID09_03010 [Candidatus Omnitrophota bacterium]